MDVVTFLVSAALLIAAGIRLAHDGDVIAAGTGLGGLWVGAILVAAATSLPELTTDVSAVWQGASSLAIGNLFGSNMANMLILALADLTTRPTRILTRVAVNQLAVGTLAVCLTACACLGLLAPGAPVLGMGWATAAVVAAYVAGMRYLHRNRAEPPFEPSEQAPERLPRAEVRRAAARFAAAALVVLIAAPFLAASAAALANRLGLSHGFAGLVLLALVTTLPEATVTLASLRAASYDLAIGNLLGSSCFNMAAIAVLDVADGRAALLAGADPELLVAALFGILLIGLAMLGVLDRAERSTRRVELGPLVMIATYLLGLALSYRAEG